MSPETNQQMQDFLQWLNGAVAMTGEVPTPEQWATVKEELHKVLGKMVADRFRDTAAQKPRMFIDDIFGPGPMYVGSRAGSDLLSQMVKARADAMAISGTKDITLGGVSVPAPAAMFSEGAPDDGR